MLAQLIWLFLDKIEVFCVLVWYPVSYVDLDFFIADPTYAIVSKHYYCHRNADKKPKVAF